MTPPQILRFIIIMTTTTLLSCHVAGELLVEPFKLAVEPGENITFTCSYSGEESNTTVVIYWTFANSSHSNLTLQQLNADQRIQLTDGVLTIGYAAHMDSGTYSCLDNMDSEPQTGVLVVYDMPDYTEEIIIISALCGALLLATLIGLVIVARRQNKKLKIAGSKSDKKGQINYAAQ